MTRTTAGTPDLDELRRAADWAHAPSPWEADSFETECGLGRYDAYQVFDAEGREILDTGNCHHMAGELQEEHGGDQGGGRLWDEAARRNTRHIAAWCPTNALAVLDLVDDLRDRLAKAEAERDAMREALRPFADEAQFFTHTDDNPFSGDLEIKLGDLRRAAALVAGQEEASTAFVESDLNPGVDPAKRAITLAADRIAALLLEEANHDVRQGMVLAKQAVMRGIVLKAVAGKEAGR